VNDEPELEPLDSAESLFRALRKEAGLTSVGQWIVAAVFLASGLVAVVGYEYAGFTHSRHRALIALAVVAGGLVVGPMLALAVAGLDASLRRLFRVAPTPPRLDADTALREAWRLGRDHESWTDDVVQRAAKLLPLLLEVGYAETDTESHSWRLTERGIARAEELEAAPD
jgi:hypothetical protein